MNTLETNQKIQWLPILIVVWNLIDIAVHVAVNMVESLRVSANIIGIVAAVILFFGVAKAYAPYILAGAAALVVTHNTVHASRHGAAVPMLIFVGVSVFLLLWWAQQELREAHAEDDNTDKGLLAPFLNYAWLAPVITLVGVVIVLIPGLVWGVTESIPSLSFDGTLEAADYWSDEPVILSAGMGFDNIIGLPELTEETVQEAGGTWHGSKSCTNGEIPDDGERTSATTVEAIARISEGFADYDDGLPVVFSWPVATETIDVTDFQFTLNTGETVFANSVTMTPNWEHNERNVVVLFGDFGNRGMSSEPDAIFPVRLDIVEDETPLNLVGPGGEEFNAVGLSWTTETSPYNFGPVLVGAKLNAVGDEPQGEGGVRLLEGNLGLPNDEFALYGDEGDYRIRVLTTGGFSPDGMTALRPDMYEDFFRVHVNGINGETVLLEKVGEDYAVMGGTLRVVGLAELGQKENPEEGIYYDDCYIEDRDNYIDIILAGNESAARNVTFVEIPALEGGYQAFYNPGGPGPEPFEGVRYTAPGPPDLEPVIIAIDDPMRVDRVAP
ncbi:MAG: phospholipase [Chloroflexota bacterium]